MNRELCKLKRELIKINTPSKEEQLAKALRTIFSNSEEMTEEEAYRTINWEYNPFTDEEKENVVVITYEGYSPILLNQNINKKSPSIEGATILNFGIPREQY
ncbi:hypothetical protein PN294_14885 [Romboutsia sp. 1001216sp1]|uniref:hypothetical protein n=1 Tax=unclassified Romboutsia TaxID=2626894 RepID=UPI00189C5B35|nr:MULTISPECIES: hypothetical protein [unclassified Romboutsia]MDB8803449.1 hypothetical protein [Romboutsia sp. 1001216sp1]MDB8803458.1 hypothetical protein [Romboutsia sp. 1001216sp1]MDB8814839.1 hypothetical protein [Romboutsia sp. 1001216sp1]MDB8814848.1 hypothetical protein [Romboutsia sp. 1001216sp1]